MQNLCRVSLAVFLGDFTGTCTGDSCTILRDNSADDDNKNLLSVQRKSSSLLVQGMVYDENGKVIVAIEDSRPHINRNNVFGWKRPDEHTLEVTDQKDRTVLHIRFMNKTTIYVELRGKVIWFLLTCRPDLLPVDLKRQGRAEEHIALFYPDTQEEPLALL